MRCNAWNGTCPYPGRFRLYMECACCRKVAEVWTCRNHGRLFDAECGTCKRRADLRVSIEDYFMLMGVG